MPFRDLPGVIQCRFKRGDYLIRAGESVEYVYYLLQGTVYRESVTDAGHETILSRKSSGNIIQSLIGVLTLYRRKSVAIAKDDFIAYTNCLCYRIPKAVCKEYLRQNPDLLEELCCTALDQCAHMEELFRSRQEGGISSRLCKLLLERSRETEEGLVVPKKCTNVEIAKFLSVHKVTVSVILRALKEQDAVVRTPQGLLLKNTQLLQQYANQELQLNYKKRTGSSEMGM